MLTILVVDDDPLVRLLLGSLAAELGHEVSFAQDGQVAALRFAEVGPDLVITDLVMPTMDGVELTKHLVVTYPGSKVIAISGKGPEMLAKAREAGAVAYLTKPLDRHLLAMTIDQVMSGGPDAWESKG
jgi:CheY-like chemotaxis protein